MPDEGRTRIPCYDPGMRAVIVALCLASSVVIADDKPLEGNVLVWADARWFVDGHEKAVTIQLGQKSRTLGAVLPAKVIATRGDFVEVELGGPSDCAWSKPAARLANLRLFVKREDLANVLVKPFAAKYKNGSRISLLPGMPIEGGRVSINGAELELAVPATSIGLSYPTPKRKPRPEAKHYFSVDGDVLLGDTKLQTKELATKIVKRGATVLFPLQAPCIDALVVAPKDAVSPDNFEIATAGLLGAGARFEERWYIAKGTPMLSASGRVVAKAREDIDIPLMVTPTTQPVCHKAEIGIHHVARDAPRIQETAVAERTLELCVPGDKIKHENPTR